MKKSDIRDGKRIGKAMEPSRISSLLGIWEISFLVNGTDVDERPFLEIALEAVRLLALLHDQTPDEILVELNADWTQDEWKDWIARRRAELAQEAAGFENG